MNIRPVAVSLAAMALTLQAAACTASPRLHGDGFDPAGATAEAYVIEVSLPDRRLTGAQCRFVEYAHVHGPGGGGVTIADCTQVTETPRTPVVPAPVDGLHNLQLSDAYGFLGCVLRFSNRVMVAPDTWRTTLAFDCPTPDWK